MGKRRSVAAEEYRREVATYLHAVKMARNLSQAELGKLAGVDSHSTVSRWLNAKNDADYGALTLIASRTGVPIPDSLRAALANSRDSGARQELRSDREAIEARLKGITPDEEEALFQALLDKRRA